MCSGKTPSPSDSCLKRLPPLLFFLPQVHGSHPSTQQSICPSIHPSIHPSVPHQSVHKGVCLSVSIDWSFIGSPTVPLRLPFVRRKSLPMFGAASRCTLRLCTRYANVSVNLLALDNAFPIFVCCVWPMQLVVWHMFFAYVAHLLLSSFQNRTSLSPHIGSIIW